MEIWKPELPPKYSAWQPSKPEVESEVSFWKPSSHSEGSIWIPSSVSGGGGGTFWEQSNWKPSPPGSEQDTGGGWSWKWTPSSESDEVTGLWKWKPSSQPTPPQDSDPSLKYNSTSSSCVLASNEPVEYHLRCLRRYDASLFSKTYKFKTGEKSCVWSNDMRRWTDKCYDTVWVAVHGVDSICMVTWLQDVDMTRVGSFYQHNCSNLQTLRYLAEAVISEVECLPYGDEKLTEKSDLGIEVPFGVVSVIKKADDETAHKDTSVAEYDETKATEFLKEKITSGSAFTYDETIQTAISAFQHLCRKELKAEDIWVSELCLFLNKCVLLIKTIIKQSCFYLSSFIMVTAWNLYKSTEHLRFKQRKKHLDVISGVSCGCNGSSSTNNNGCPTDSDRPLNMIEVISNVIAATKRRKCSAA